MCGFFSPINKIRGYFISTVAAAAVRVEEGRTDRGCIESETNSWFKVITVTVEACVPVQRVERRSQSSGHDLNLDQRIPREHVFQVGECIVDVLAEAEFDGHEAAGTVVRIDVSPSACTVRINLVVIDPLLDTVEVELDPDPVCHVRLAESTIHVYNPREVYTRDQEQRLAIDFRPNHKKQT